MFVCQQTEAEGWQLQLQEPLPKPDRVPALGSLLMPRQDDDDEDLERLAVGLKVCCCLHHPRQQCMSLIVFACKHGKNFVSCSSPETAGLDATSGMIFCPSMLYTAQSFAATPHYSRPWKACRVMGMLNCRARRRRRGAKRRRRRKSSRSWAQTKTAGSRPSLKSFGSER